MKHHSIFTIFLFAGFAVIFLVGCSTKDDIEAINVTEDLIVTFNGKTCEYDGPLIIREGEITMIMNNLSDSPVTLDLAELDDDKTWQDMLDYIGEPGSNKQRPGWITKENRKPVISDPSAAIFSPDPGNYVIVCYQTVQTGFATFPGSPLEVR